MKLSIVFPMLNQFELTTEAITLAIQQLSGDNEVELVVIDNGSNTPYEFPETHKEFIINPIGGAWHIEHLVNNIGVYPTFWEALKFTTGDVLAFFHSDTLIFEKNWDTRVLEAFESHEKLGLLGFIGSDEIDSSGGRGVGTASNFLGGEIKYHEGKPDARNWKGSPAEAHGKRLRGYMNAAVVDGCAMILRESVLKEIPQRENFPPHHFYDRMLATEVLERGYEVGVLGIGFDHISGQTVNQESSYDRMAEAWATAHGLSKGDLHNWDSVIYQEAERQWLKEYRDEKHLVPIKV